MSCWETVQDYALRSIGIGERLLPREGLHALRAIHADRLRDDRGTSISGCWRWLRLLSRHRVALGKALETR
jgi:hypothetical protein